MTAALILMTSACVAGSDCGGCAAPAPSCDPCARVGLLDKVKARLALMGRKNDCCDPCAKPAPSCAPACAPAPTCAPACEPACGKPLFDGSFLARFKRDDCGCDPCAKPKLLDRLKAKFARPSCDTGCSTGCDSGCGAAPAHAAPAAPGAPATPAPAAPKAMPAPGKTTSNIVPGSIRPVGGNAF